MPFVALLVTDSGAVENPTWDDVERAIGALDADSCTEVMLSPAPPDGPPEGDHHMGIGGGKDGRYIVYATEDNMLFWNLKDASKSADATPVRMSIGGQEGEYLESQCISRSGALTAARDYFERGQRTSSLEWTPT